MKKIVFVLVLTMLSMLIFIITGCNPASITNTIQGGTSTTSKANDIGVPPISLELTYPAGMSPKVFTTGWVFGVRCVANPGTGEEKDISDQVKWSGDAVFTPVVGSISRPTFKKAGANTITLTATYGSKTAQKQYTVTAVSPLKYARVGDNAECLADAHGCPACPHVVKGTIMSGSPEVLLNGLPAARVGDTGIHMVCCGPNTFEIVTGDQEVLINGRPAARIGDKTKHCGGSGEITSGVTNPTFTTTGTASAKPSTTSSATYPITSPSTSAGLLVWVRDDAAVTNANKDPLEVQSTEARFEGSFSKMTVNEIGFSTQERYVDHGNEYYNVTIKCDFDTPPLVLNPGLRYKIKANFSHSGTYKQGGEGLGEQFWYNSERKGLIDPAAVLKYYPWSPSFDGTASKEWMLTAPPVSKGATFKVFAGLWNRPPCNVTWTYRAEYHE
jgi:uncharacterized Zn-binding protein involved in type VI secretion